MAQDRDGKVVVTAWLPKDMVKRLDHVRIDREMPTRQALVQQILMEWLKQQEAR